ncbi:radical SAM protein [bacterium]|nr:radical SAM protein [bacterium]
MNEERAFFRIIRGTAGAFRRDTGQLLKRMLHRLRIVPPPLRVSIDITNRCSFRCPTCSKWRDSASGPELEFAAWQQILRKIRRTPLLREIAFSGGEPFIRDDMAAILEEASLHGLRSVVVSNGDLITEKTYARLSSIPGCTLMLSLNSLRAEVHDATRGVPGSYAAIMRLIDRWRNSPGLLQLSLSTIIMEPNSSDIIPLAHFVRDNRLIGIIYQALLPTDVHYSFAEKAHMPDPEDRWYEDNPLWFRDPDSVRRDIGTLLKLQRRGFPILNPPLQLKQIAQYATDPSSLHRFPCIGTTQRLYIDPAGDMRLCYGFPPIGNILTDDPAEVWRGKGAHATRIAARSCNRPCRLLNCNL